MSPTEPNTRRLCNWLIRMAGDGGGRVSLGHVTAAGPGVALGQWAIRQEDDEQTLRQLAEAIMAAAVDDADGHVGGTPQQYTTLFYHHAEPNKQASRLPLRLAMAEQFAPEGSALATEPPTERGLVSQALRHNEFLVRTSLGAMGSAASQLERHNIMLGDQVTRLTEQVFEMQRERQELLDRDAERLLEIERFEADRDHRDRMTSELFSVGRGLLLSLSNGGKPLQLPVSTDQSAEEGEVASGLPKSVPASAVLALGQIQELLRSLTPEQIQTISSALTPMQQGSLFLLYQKMALPEGDETEEGAEDEGAGTEARRVRGE